jgi:hypothetical protein
VRYILSVAATTLIQFLHCQRWTFPSIIGILTPRLTSEITSSQSSLLHSLHFNFFHFPVNVKFERVIYVASVSFFILYIDNFFLIARNSISLGKSKIRVNESGATMNELILDCGTGSIRIHFE